MQTYATPYNTPNYRSRYAAASAEKETFQENPAFASCPTLNLWDCDHGSLAAGEARLFRVRFDKGHPVRLRAWANASLGLSLQDVSGRTVAREHHAAGHPNCRILPNRSGEYVLQLVNTTDHEAHYVLYIADEMAAVA